MILQQNGLKLGDFGSCRSVYSKPPHTEYISTRWYRAPECLLTDGYYSLKMDMWSAGCVFFEIMRYLCRGTFHLSSRNRTTVHGFITQDWLYLITYTIMLPMSALSFLCFLRDLTMLWQSDCLIPLCFSLNPLFPGANELDQVAKIHDVLGTPDESILQKFKQ